MFLLNLPADIVKPEFVYISSAETGSPVVAALFAFLQHCRRRIFHHDFSSGLPFLFREPRYILFRLLYRILIPEALLQLVDRPKPLYVFCCRTPVLLAVGFLDIVYRLFPEVDFSQYHR